jgi:hypothetical protein
MDTETITETEQKYFDTRGAAPLAPEPPAEELEPSPGDGEGPATAAEEPADGAENVDEGKADENNPGKFVRHGAFHEERQKRKQVESEFIAYREQEAARNARLEERLNMLSQALKPPDPPPVTDPNERLALVEKEIRETKQQEQQRLQLQHVQEQFFNAVAVKEREFAADNPDYYEAIEFARAERLKDIQSLGYPADEAVRMLEQDIINISDDAFARRINPAERFYGYAKSRGWGKQQAPAQAKEQPPADKLKTIAAGQAAGKSLSTAPGTSQAALTLQALADMPQEEFDKIDAKTWRKMMGG